MKNRIGLGVCVFLFLLYMESGSFAAPVGNPAGPVLLEGHYPAKFSLEAETVLERKLKSKQPGSPTFKCAFYTAKVSVYNNKKLDIYGLIGIGDQGRVKSFTNAAYTVETKMGTVLGGGISYVLHELEWQGGILRIGADAKYRQYDPDVDSIMRYRTTIKPTNGEFDIKEWQASLGLSYQHKNFVPYCGIKYSDVDAGVALTDTPVSRAEQSDKSMSSKNIVGIFYGFDFLLRDNISLNIEGRNIDENAVNAGLNIKF